MYGTFGDAGVIGWQGNSQAVVACLGGSFWVDTSGPDGGPGSASTAAVTGTTYGYGVYDDSPTTWTNADGYLPALVTTFHRGGATHLDHQLRRRREHRRARLRGHLQPGRGDQPDRRPITVNPQPSAGLVPLNKAPDTVPPHATVNHDYAVPADRFGGSYAYPQPRRWRPRAATTSTSRTCGPTGTASWPRSRRSPRCPTRA